MADTSNIALRLRDAASRQPDQPAVIVMPRRAGAALRHQLSFADLERRTDALARGFRRIGIAPGLRTLVMIRPGADFVAVMFALFKAGAVPVLIDPGMGRRWLLHCIAHAQPEAMIGIPLAHVLRLVRPRAFASVRHAITAGRRWLWGGPALAHLADAGESPFPIAATAPDDLAGIFFTTGSTGPPKGVEYAHGMCDAQCRLLAETFGMHAGDVDLPTFPPFALFSVALGLTAVLPHMDPTRPASVDPRAILAAIDRFQCTCSFGSPALWSRVTQYCVNHEITLPALKTVLMAGAPVPVEVHERFRKILGPEAATHTPYGATESLPTTDILGSEVLADTAKRTRQGRGVCVGRAVAGTRVAVIRLTDEAIPAWSPDLVLPAGEVGEIVSQGPQVTRRYFRLEEATAASKIRDGDRFWHRMGDLGYQDQQGRIWFCGRKSHRVQTAHGLLLPVCVEAIFNQLPAVRRSALIGLGERPVQTPALVVEPVRMPRSRAARARFAEALRGCARAHETTACIQRFFFRPVLPVDIRHNAKIRRQDLAVWAAAQAGEDVP